VLVVIALVVACFSRLVAEPGGLIVDGERPSVDYALREDFRGVGNDLTFAYLPHYWHVSEQVAAHGRLPQWDDSGFGGRPMIGNPQGGLFYPPVWLALLSRWPAALGWLTIGHLVWAGVGTYVLARSLGTGAAPATVAAGCFAISPYLLGHLFEGHYPHVWTVSWYPWAFWAYLRFRRDRGFGLCALPPILAISFLAGHPQEWHYLVFALSVWTVADAACAVKGGSGRRRIARAFAPLAAWAAVGALTVGLVAIELVPCLIAQEWTLRSSRFALGRVSHYQLHPLNLLQLFGPSALGGPADYFGNDNRWETLLSIGLIPLVLATFAMAKCPNRNLVRAWGILVIGAVVFAAGRYLGLFTLLYEIVPGMNRFRVPARSLFLASLGAAVLAGFGVEALVRTARDGTDWRALARQTSRAALIVVVVLAGLSAMAGRNERLPEIARAIGPATLREIRAAHRSPSGLRLRSAVAASRLLASATFWVPITGVVGILGLGVVRPNWRRGLAVSLGGLALIELTAHGHGLIKVSPADRFLGPDPISSALAHATPPVHGPFRIRARDTLYQDLRAVSHGLEKINIYDSFQIQHAAVLYQKLYALLYVQPHPNSAEPMSEPVAEHYRRLRQAILDRLNVAFLVSDHVEPEPAWPLVASGNWDGSVYAVHRNPTALPRAYVAARAEATPDDAWDVLSQFRDLDPREAVVLPSDPLGALGGRQPFMPARWLSNDPDRVVVEVDTVAPGLLVIADTWMPGWSAKVDGRPAPILRGNHAQRVIPLRRAGRQRIVMSYEAPGLALGFAITFASALGWGVVLVVRWRIPTQRSGGSERTDVRSPHTGRHYAAVSLRTPSEAT
jgi:hypothetical protein